MKPFVKAVGRFLVSQQGPTAVEYAVMLALIVLVCLTAISSLGINVRNALNQLYNSVVAAAPG